MKIVYVPLNTDKYNQEITNSGINFLMQIILPCWNYCQNLMVCVMPN